MKTQQPLSNDDNDDGATTMTVVMRRLGGGCGSAPGLILVDSLTVPCIYCAIKQTDTNPHEPVTPQYHMVLLRVWEINPEPIPARTARHLPRVYLHLGPSLQALQQQHDRFHTGAGCNATAGVIMRRA